MKNTEKTPTSSSNPANNTTRTLSHEEASQIIYNMGHEIALAGYQQSIGLSGVGSLIEETGSASLADKSS